MKYTYRIEHTPSGSPVMQLPPEIALATGFLFSDVQWSNGPHYLSRVDAVLTGEVPSWGETGNVYNLEIEPETTTITDMLAEEDATDNECTLETSELREILVLWIEETKHLATP